MSSWFPKSASVPCPHAVKGEPQSRERPPQAEGLEGPAGFSGVEGALRPRAKRRGALGKEPNFEGQSGKPGERAVRSDQEQRPGLLAEPSLAPGALRGELGEGDEVGGGQQWE